MPLTGFGSNLAKGVAKAVGESGWLGVIPAVLVILTHVHPVLLEELRHDLMAQYDHVCSI